MALRQLEKALDSTFNDGTLPEEAIDAFIAKNTPIDNATSSKLHEELSKLASKPDLPEPFLNALVRLAPYIINNNHAKWWFAKLAPSAVDSGGHSNVLVRTSREFLLSVMSGEPDDEQNRESAELNAKTYLRYLTRIYIGDSEKWITPISGERAEERRRFLKYNCRNLLLENVGKNLEETLRALNVALVKPEYRLEILQVLSELAAQSQSSKLFKIANTPVLESLFKTLEYDNVNASLAIAGTTLAMILPHLLDKLIPLLPRVYACFGRLCSWQPVHFGLTDITGASAVTGGPQGLGEGSKQPSVKNGWIPLTPEPDSPSGNGRLPDATPLFTFLYGLFPSNTLQFCKQATDYLKLHNYQRPFNDFWDRFAILHRAEELFTKFTLNPLLLSHSPEQELDIASTRWDNFKSTTDIIMTTLDLRVSDPSDFFSESPSTHLTDTESKDADYDEDNDELDEQSKLQELLAEHQRLFHEALGSGGMALLGPYTGRHQTSAISATRQQMLQDISLSPQKWSSSLRGRADSLRHTQSTASSPSLAARALKDFPASPELSLSSPRASSPRLQGTSSRVLDGMMLPGASMDSEQNASVQTRTRSQSQPLRPASIASEPVPPLPVTVSSSVVSQGPNSGPPSTYAASTAPTSSTNAVVQHFVRELLLNKNELDFANFSKYIIERKLIKLQKQLAELDITNIRLEYVAGNNKHLATKLRELEDENQKAQKMARTLLRQRTTYESTLMDKNKDFKAQLVDKDKVITSLQEDKHRLETESTSLVSMAYEREARIAEIEVRLADNEAQLQLIADRPNIHNEIEEVSKKKEKKLQQAKDSEFESRYQQALLDIEGLQADRKAEADKARRETEALRTQLKEAERRSGFGGVSSQLYDTRKIVSDLKAAEQARYEKLNDAHEELLVRYSNLEREVKARRVHEEERMNELRAAVMSARPFSFQDSETPRVRGRGGVQKSVPKRLN